MSKNPSYNKSLNPTHKKGSLSQDSSPLYAAKIKKDTSNCFQPAELDSQLKLTPKSAAVKKTNAKLTTNVFINNLSVQIGSNQTAQRKTPTPLSASGTNRKNSKPLSSLSQKEEALLAEYRENKSRQKNRTPQTGLDAAINHHHTMGNSGYELRKNPMAIVPRHHSEASNDILKSGYIPKFKGSDPSNKFTLRSPQKAFAQIETTTTFKKPNGRKQKSFDANAPMTKYTPYLNSYLRPPTTANNSPRDKGPDAKPTQNGPISQMLMQTIGPKVTKNPLERNPSASKAGSKSSTVVPKHRKTPSYDITKRSESISQKILTPPILDRMRRSADCGDYWQGNLSVFNNPNTKNAPQFAIRTRAGVAPNGTRKVNQDSFVFHTNYGKRSDRYLLGVCDGHGMNGHLVSGFVKETLPVYLLADPAFESDLGGAFTNAFELCLQKLLVCDIDCRFSGTTAAFMLVEGNKIMTANAGDSRAIIASCDKQWDFRPLTTDHKPDSPGEAQRIIKCGGRIEPFKDMEGGFVGPSRVWLLNQDIPGLAMSRSIGDLVAASVGVSCVPEIKEFTINPDDKFMIIASDGVWEFIENIDVVKVIVPFYEQRNIEGACDYLMSLAVKRWQEEEEVVVDDITFIIVFF